MLKHATGTAGSLSIRRGIVLMLALIVLVAMSLAAAALMRSALTSNQVAANLAFQQSAAQSADVGVERAIAWLEQKTRELASENPPVLANLLFNSITAGGSETVNYVARREDPGAGATWDSFWREQLVANNQINSLPIDTAGNQVAFAIHRLCNSSGDALSSGCESPALPGIQAENSSKSSSAKLQIPSQTCYRITVRVEGPRHAVSFVQVVVAM